MIYLTKGQILFENPSMLVCDQTGYYNDGDPVICASLGKPDEPVCRYEAKFVAYGGSVYSISDPEKLTEEILKNDPASLFGKDGQVIADEKMIEKIQTVDTTKPPAEITKPENPENLLSEPTPDPVPEPEVVPEPEPAPEVIPEPEIVSEPEVLPEPEILPEPVPETPIEVIPEIIPEVVPESEAVTDQVTKLFKKIA